MKITRVDVMSVRVPPTKIAKISTYGTSLEAVPVLTKVYTDDGAFGLGECAPMPPLSPEPQEVIVNVLKNWIIPQILGEDPFNVERIWEKMDLVAARFPLAKAPIDMALYDLMGKALNVPVFKLLGGLYARRFPIVALIGIGTPQEVVGEARRYVDEGYTGLRLKIGPKRDVENVRAIREAVGGDITLRVDGNQGYSPSMAVKAIKAMEPYDVELVEQPTPWWDFSGLATVAKAVNTPIMAHESLYLTSDLKALLELGAMDVLGLKVLRPGGGVTSAKKILSLAHLMNIPCMIHDDIELGVSLAASTHLIAANLRDIQFKPELSGYPEWLIDDVVKAPLRIGKGFAEVPEGVGLGVELDDAKIKKYSSGPTITCK